MEETESKQAKNGREEGSGEFRKAEITHNTESVAKIEAPLDLSVKEDEKAAIGEEREDTVQPWGDDLLGWNFINWLEVDQNLLSMFVIGLVIIDLIE